MGLYRSSRAVTRSSYDVTMKEKRTDRGGVERLESFSGRDQSGVHAIRWRYIEADDRQAALLILERRAFQLGSLWRSFVQDYFDSWENKLRRHNVQHAPC